MSRDGGRSNGRLPQTNVAVFARRDKLLSIPEHCRISDGTIVSRNCPENRAVIEIQQSRSAVIGAHQDKRIVRSQRQVTQRNFRLRKLTHHFTGLKIHEPD